MRRVSVFVLFCGFTSVNKACLVSNLASFAVGGLMSGPLLKEVFATLSQNRQTPDDYEVDDTDDEEQDEVR